MSNILQKNLVNTFGLDGLSDEEKAVFLDEIGATVLEAALVRFMEELSDDRVAALNYYLDTEPTADALMEHLLNQYQDFSRVLEEVIVELKEDVEFVLGNDDEQEADLTR